MAKRTQAVAVEPEPEFAKYVDKDPTRLHQNFAAWLTEKTGYEVDEKSVQLATALRMVFQRSEENQEDLIARREQAEAEKVEREQRREERAAKAAERAEKLAAREAAPAKAPAAKKAAAKAAPAAKTATKVAPPRRRAAATASA